MIIKSGNKLFILSIAFLLSCSINRHDFIVDEEIKNTNLNGQSIRYTVYQTGIDNYTYHLYITNNQDTTNLFLTYLNDASYKNVIFKTEHKEDSVVITSNFNMGHQTCENENTTYILNYKPYPKRNRE